MTRTGSSNNKNIRCRNKRNLNGTGLEYIIGNENKLPGTVTSKRKLNTIKPLFYRITMYRLISLQMEAVTITYATLTFAADVRSRTVLLKAGGIAPLGAILRGKGVKKNKRGGKGGKTTQRRRKRSNTTTDRSLS